MAKIHSVLVPCILLSQDTTGQFFYSGKENSGEAEFWEHLLSFRFLQSYNTAKAAEQGCMREVIYLRRLFLTLIVTVSVVLI